jgi:hypothetical protein
VVNLTPGCPFDIATVSLEVEDDKVRPCEVLEAEAVTEEGYLSIVFRLRNVCEEPTGGLNFLEMLAVIISCGVAFVFILVLLVIFVVPRCRRKVMPYRDRDFFKGAEFA